MSCNSLKNVLVPGPLTTKQGILLFTGSRIEYFFPFTDSSNILKSNYQKKEFAKGFLLSSTDQSYNYDLRKLSDTLLDDFNSAFTNVMAVKIEYQATGLFTDTTTDETYLMLNDKRKVKLFFDVTPRFVRKISPLF